MKLVHDKVIYTHWRGAPIQATFVFTFQRKLDADDRAYVNFGYSLCSDKDMFSRKKGREQALKRLEANPLTISVNDSHNDHWFTSKQELVNLAFSALLVAGELPRIARRLWLQIIALYHP